MIEIASDNHIAELRKLSKRDVKDGLNWGSLVDLETFKEQVLSGFVGSDETSMWCCFHDGEYYVGADDVYFDCWNQKFVNKPDWATMVYWYGK